MATDAVLYSGWYAPKILAKEAVWNHFGHQR